MTVLSLSVLTAKESSLKETHCYKNGQDHIQLTEISCYSAMQIKQGFITFLWNWTLMSCATLEFLCNDAFKSSTWHQYCGTKTQKFQFKTYK